MAELRVLPFFPHRLNKDGSYDSICLQCFATVATAATSAALDEHDIEHTCREESLLKRGVMSRFRAG